MSDADKTQIGGTFYKDMPVQPWDALEAWMTPEQFQGYLLGSAIAYLSRFNVNELGKGGKIDLQKANHYICKLLETL